jgi:hypothetical protein
MLFACIARSGDLDPGDGPGNIISPTGGGDDAYTEAEQDASMPFACIARSGAL